MPVTITDVVARDVRFPTSENLDGSDAMNQAPDYSAAYVILKTDSDPSKTDVGQRSGPGESRTSPGNKRGARGLPRVLNHHAGFAVPPVQAAPGSGVCGPWR
jgi:hypothetical protein